MNIREVVELTKSFRNDLAELKKDFKNEIEYFDSIIELLECGEKYENIVKEIEYNLDWHKPECPFTTPDTELLDEILQLIADIKQKYFPEII